MADVCHAVVMVNLTKIYTRTGDDGTTALGDFGRTSKNDPRLEAYADANEANAAIGIAVAAGGLREDVNVTLKRVQNDLFDVGADLSTPLKESYEYPPLRVEQAWIDELEQDCDRFLDELEPLRSFILPGARPDRRTCTWRARSCDGRSVVPGRPWRRTGPNRA